MALRGDMGWNSCYVKPKSEVFRMWIKLRNVSDDRILKTVHKWLKRNTRCWERKIIKRWIKQGFFFNGPGLDTHCFYCDLAVLATARAHI